MRGAAVLILLGLGVHLGMIRRDITPCKAVELQGA